VDFLVLASVTLAHLLQEAKTSLTLQDLGATTKFASVVQHEQFEIEAFEKQAHCWGLKAIFEVIWLKKNLFAQSQDKLALVVLVAGVLSHLHAEASEPMGQLCLNCWYWGSETQQLQALWV
jgi:hypothetical protein